MTRFREEHYVTRAWKKASATGTLNQTSPPESDRRQSRSQYHKELSAYVKAKQIAPAWRKLDAF